MIVSPWKSRKSCKWGFSGPGRNRTSGLCLPGICLEQEFSRQGEQVERFVRALYLRQPSSLLAAGADAA